MEMPPKIGKFRMIRKIGQGRASVVYHAYDPYMDRDVAIKVTPPEFLAEHGVRKRVVELFFTESKVCGMLQHRHILPVYDAGEEDNLYYLVMEYIEDGRTLLEYCRPDNLMPVTKAIEIIFQCSKALQYAHSRNVLHLDVKPGNILLTREDRAKLADFGLAKVLDPFTDRLQLSAIRGTPTHLSPELVRMEPLTQQTDIYSLGVVMYYVLTGQRPFPAKELQELLAQILHDDPPALAYYRPEVPELLEPIVRKAMARNPKDRYATVADLADDLYAFHARIVHVVVTTNVGTREKIDRLTGLPFFRDFFETELAEVVHAAEWIEYEPGRTILSEGALDESFYIVVEGELSVLIDGKKKSVLGPGDCFGEMAYVAKRVREAGIATETGAAVLKISNELLEKMSVYCQLKFTKVFLNTLIARLAR